MAKNDVKNTKQVTIDAAHQPDTKPTPTLIQRQRNDSYSIGTSLRRGLLKISHDKHHDRFATANSKTKFYSANIGAMITYASGADGHYISEADRKPAGLPILRPPRRNDGVANGGINKGRYVTKLPFKQLSSMAAQADTETMNKSLVDDVIIIIVSYSEYFALQGFLWVEVWI